MSAPTTTPDRATAAVVGAMVGWFVGLGGWMVGLWDLVVPFSWRWGAGWWVPVLACTVAGAVRGAVKHRAT